MYSLFQPLMGYLEDLSRYTPTSLEGQIREIEINKEEGIISSLKNSIKGRGLPQNRFILAIPKQILKVPTRVSIEVYRVERVLLPLMGIATERYRVLRN